MREVLVVKLRADLVVEAANLTIKEIDAHRRSKLDEYVREQARPRWWRRERGASEIEAMVRGDGALAFRIGARDYGVDRARATVLRTLARQLIAENEQLDALRPRMELTRREFDSLAVGYNLLQRAAEKASDG